MKAIFKYLILTIFLVNSVNSADGQENEFITRLKTQLLLYRTQKIDQSIVIQTDKSLYRPGETIWMKGYVTDALTHLPSLKSLELSVFLSNHKGTNVLEGKFLLKNGVADFSLVIPADLQNDVYNLIGFTPEMESLGIEEAFRKELVIGRLENLDLVPHVEYSKPFFLPEQKETATIGLTDLAGKPQTGKKFEYQIISKEHELLSGKGKTGLNGTGDFVFITPSQKNKEAMLVSFEITSGNDQINIVDKIPITTEKVNINFYPEGGKLVSGIPQKVIYEATDQMGNPLSLKADIIDDQEKIVTSTITIQPGLGVFTILNDARKLKMKITGDIGKDQEVALPIPSPENMSISIKKNDGKSISLLLGRSPKSERAKFMIVAVANGEMIWASDFELEQAGVLNVPLENFRSAIAAIAVFDPSGKMVAQRLVYTGKTPLVNVSMTPGKGNYKPGETGEITVKISDAEGNPVKAELSASLADRFAFPSPATVVNFLNYGLSKPLPFKEALEKVNKIALDYYLTANSLKGLDWSQIVSIDPSKTLNINNILTRVSGRVIDSKNIPVSNALINLTNSSLQQFNARSDQHGEFVIGLPTGVDRKNLSASATDETGKGNFKVILNQGFKEELTNSLNGESIKNWQILEQLQQSKYFLENPDFLKAATTIKSKGYDAKPKAEPYWKKYLSTSTNMIDILKSIKSFEIMGGKIVFRGGNSFIAQDGALIVVDGQRMGTDASLLTQVNPYDVEDIQIFVNPSDMSRYTSLNSVGVIDITTKRGAKYNFAILDNQNSKETAPAIFQPKSIGNDKYDLKTTLQWIPDLYTNEKGEFIVPFTASHIKSTYVLTIAGITDQGQWIGDQIEIKVE